MNVTARHWRVPSKQLDSDIITEAGQHVNLLEHSPSMDSGFRDCSLIDTVSRSHEQECNVGSELHRARRARFFMKIDIKRLTTLA